MKACVPVCKYCTVRFLTQILPQSFQHAVDLHGWDSRPTAADKNHGVQTLKISTSFDMALHNKSFQGHQDPEPDLLFLIHLFVSCSVQGTITYGADGAQSCHTNLSSRVQHAEKPVQILLLPTARPWAHPTQNSSGFCQSQPLKDLYSLSSASPCRFVSLDFSTEVLPYLTKKHTVLVIIPK